MDSESLRQLGAEQGGLIPSTRRAAFSMRLPEDMPIPVLIAVPHAGRDYPASLVERMRKPAFSKIRLEDRYVDRMAAEVAHQTGAALLVSHAPRAMLDLNRDSNDVDWDMVADGSPEGARHSAANRRARSGLGLVPRRLPGLGEIWSSRLSNAELSTRIRQVHTPYHAALAAGLQRLRDHWGVALLVDLHSMPPLKKSNAGDVPAEFVIGDRFGASADDRLVASALRHFAEQGLTVAHNRPYAGGFILDRHSAPGQNIHAIQVEMCRSLYLDDEMMELSQNAGRLVSTVTRLVRRLGEVAARLDRPSFPLQAAE
ncbi:N-formylglutamate amidohydrolase [Pontixanthobacter gangjinensis]|uniref:N-formylglutamate amidohydrolase n=1 Tax=Pontixanthobacter gangjinensis TaxID=1028742 RepID=UPI001925EBF1|nr:N-formylglutamate amidohydrolase [Pontixanthobacter gangjinensis]